MLGYNFPFMFHFPALHFSTWGWVAVIGGAFAIGMNKGGLTGLGVLPVLLFAMGDGNHSLATAKAIWEKMKPQPG